MGLLDEAIREHIELKRRRGADPREVARQERDALGPAVGGHEEHVEHEAAGEPGAFGGHGAVEEPGAMGDPDAGGGHSAVGEHGAVEEHVAVEHAEDSGLGDRKTHSVHLENSDFGKPSHRDLGHANFPPEEGVHDNRDLSVGARPAREPDFANVGQETAELDMRTVLDARPEDDSLEVSPENPGAIPGQEQLWLDQQQESRDFDFDR